MVKNLKWDAQAKWLLGIKKSENGDVQVENDPPNAKHLKLDVSVEDSFFMSKN